MTAFYSPGSVKYPSNRRLEIPKPTMAEKLRDKAKAAQKEREEVQKKKAQNLYEELLPEFEKAAEQGSTMYLVVDRLLNGCHLQVFNRLMTEEGFITNNDDRGICVRWGDEPAIGTWDT